MGQRRPGSQCGSQVGPAWIDEGTTCRSRSNPPGPIGADSRKVATKYTRRPDDSGWLAILLSPTNKRAALCEFTKVEIEGERDGRLFFELPAVTANTWVKKPA
jgi:hypothetical protein